jgi:hypothetical protein
LIWINAPKNQRFDDCSLREEAFMLASNPVKTDPAFNSVIAAFRGWLRNRKLIRQCRQRLDACDKNEIARIARDVGLSSSDLRQMAELGPDAAKLGRDRMATLHLDADALAKSDPSTTRDLQRLCSSCVSKKRCQRDLLLVPDDSMWRHYCPNADTLDALQSEAANAP